MNQYLITLDGGTTNTRAVLWNAKKEVVALASAKTGVKNTAEDGNNNQLKAVVKQLIAEVMQQAAVTYEQITAVYVCGMLTSEVGLMEVPHLCAPVNREDYRKGVKTARIEEIAPIPIHFIPGMKNQANTAGMDDLETMDMMRGEEMEALALLEQLDKHKDYLLVLPGSHTKFVASNQKGEMTGCLTSMSGELLEVLTIHSIVADAVNRQFAAECFDRSTLLLGCRQTLQTSFARAAFLTRTAKLQLGLSPEQCAYFLLGAVLANDILAVKKSQAIAVNKDTEIVIAGKQPLANAMKDIFEAEGSFASIRVHKTVPDLPLSGMGMFLIARERGDIYRGSVPMLEEILQEKIIAIIRGIESKYILNTAQALLAGAIKMMEITFDQSSEAGLRQTLQSIELVNREFGSDILLGAGTVMSREQAEWAAERGAGYLISANVDTMVIQRTKELGLVSMPGALTPTEAVLAYQAGADIVKLFPAGVLGAAYIKALCAPLAQIPVAAVGGVDKSNIASFFEAGVSCVGIGGSLVNSRRVRQGEYAAITEAAKGLRAQIEGQN